MSKSSGQIVEQTTHIFDLVRYLLGDVKSIYAVANIGLTTDVPNYDVRDASVVSLVFKSGVVANITSSCIVEAGGGVRLDMGEQGFREMVLAAKEAGYRITPNMNALGLDYALPEFRRMWRHQVADREGNKLGWPGTFPGAATHAFAYMRPCARAWREHLVKKIVEFITEYDLDAAYLDQTLVVIDDPRCNFENGMRRLVGEVRKQLPNVLIGGEGRHERIIGSVPFFQMHGAPWTNTALGLPYEKDSPIFTKLFGEYAIFCGHISIPVPFPGRQVGLLAAGPFWDKWWAGDEGYRIAQEHYDRRGAIKTLRLNLKDFGLDEETKRVIETLKN